MTGDAYRNPPDLSEDVRAAIRTKLDAEILGQKVDDSGRLLLACVDIARYICLDYYRLGKLAEVPFLETTREDVRDFRGSPRHRVSLNVRGRPKDKIWEAIF